ncbi:hypothetical protein [Phenylobacterium sp. J367]|uniref:hypothetical protein n=1 Tax=Phenylobacterium sp. J367 TaxID=2898435 RepID=UPI0035B4369B
MLADDLAWPTRRLDEQFRRNLDRFPGAFQLTPEEAEGLRSQSAASNAPRRGGAR